MHSVAESLTIPRNVVPSQRRFYQIHNHDMRLEVSGIQSMRLQTFYSVGLESSKPARLACDWYTLADIRVDALLGCCICGHI